MGDNSDYDNGYHEGSKDALEEFIKKTQDRIDSLVDIKEQEIRVLRAEINLLRRERHIARSQFE